MGLAARDEGCGRQAPGVGRVGVAQVVYSDKVVRGADVVIADLAGAQLRQGRVTPIVIAAASDEYADRLQALGVPCIRFPTVYPNRLHYLGAFLRMAALDPAQHGVHVVHTHGARGLYLLVALRRLTRGGWTRIPLVYTRHDDWMDATAVERLRTRIECWCYREVDVLIACSPHLLPRLQHHVGRGRLVQVPNGIVRPGRTPGSPRRRMLRERYGLSPQTRVVGVIGRLVPSKRLDLFLLVARRVASELGDIVFLIVGGGSERSRLEALVDSYGLRSRVHFTGEVRDVIAVCGGLTLLLHTSDREGLPVVILQAMAMGVAVVATRVGGIPALIDDGVHGLLATPGAAEELTRKTLRLLRDPRERSRLARRARGRFEAEFTIDAVRVQLEALYLEAVREHPRARVPSRRPGAR